MNQMHTFLKISVRHLWHSRLYSVINILGLATGITCMLLAVLYWKYEHGFDGFHKNNPHLYRITTTLIENKGSRSATVGGTGQVQGPAFKEAIPEVRSYVRVMGGDIYNDVFSGNKTLNLQPLFVDDSFFDVFNFPLLSGDPKTVLKDINSVVITESTAKKFFNSSDVIGRTLNIDADPSFEKLGKPLVISGVVKDPPENSSLQFDALFTFRFMHLSFEDSNWLNAYLGTFVTLHPNANIGAVEKKFNKVYSFHAKQQLAENIKTYGYDPQISYGLQRITDIHLNPLMRTTGNAEAGIINGSSPVYSYMFMGIALFILLMAAINFINISIASSLKRSKEVGVRKVAGGSRTQIIFQFLHESAILCVMAFFLSVILLNISLPLFNNLTGKQLVLSESFDAKLLIYFITVLTGIILLTGVYPAYVLSNFKPSEVLYNKQKLSGRNVLGRGLVVMQFSLTVFLLIATIVYYNQMDYIRTKDLGYNPNQIIRTAIGGDRDYRQIIGLFKNELEKEPSIKMVSFGNDGYAEDMYVNGRVFKGIFKNVDENFLPALEIPLKAGENFSPVWTANEKNGAIVNEAFVKAAGLQHPIGQSIKINRYYDSCQKMITGVVKDFHFGSLREPISPMVMYMNEWPDGGIWVKFEKSKQKHAMAAMERIYRNAMPNAIYHYNFLDELNAKQYLQEQRWHQVISIATILSFIICCLGLFGLAHLSTNQRIKEIGIRKVLGASGSQIVALLSADFLKLVVIAFAVSAPVSWIVMNNWLQDFAYRKEISWPVFASAGVIAFLIALVTVSFQAIKAAIANPVKSLRTE
ncbi:MAG: ABC transporter permease [Chitinophagaceae bacterium]|nr:ABC transporter permease [Chitinophagaceae bacterium]